MYQQIIINTHKFLNEFGKNNLFKLHLLGLSVILFWSVGCKRNTIDEHKNEISDNNLEPYTHTLYSEKYELFVEHKPIIVDSITWLNTHLTIQGDNFLPLSKGKVTVNLVIGNDNLKFTTESTVSPGLFKLPLKPNKAGKGKLIFEIISDSSTDKFEIDDIIVYPNVQTALKTPKQEHSANEVTYSKEQAWKIPFASMPVRKSDFSSLIKTSGIITSAPGDEAMVSAKSEGIVKFINNQLTIGSPINAGTPMFAISGGGLAQGNIDAGYKQAMANYNQAKANYERTKELVKDQIVSQREYLDAKVTFENAQVSLDLISKNYKEGSGQSNVATISGFIKSILITDGQYVTAGTPLAMISKNKRLLLQANISQKHFNLLPVITSANFKISGSDEVYNTQDLNGRVVSYGKSTGKGTAFVPILFEIENKVNIIPGSAVEFFLKSTSISNAIVIPVSAFMEEQGLYFVYIQTGGESFEKREIKVSDNDGENVRVLSGLTEGERVVTKGAFQIKLSTATGSIPAHEH